LPSIGLRFIKETLGGTLKPWPEFVEGLFGGGLNYQTCVFYEFVGFVRFYK